MKRAGMSTEEAAVVSWLQAQPGVTSVTAGRYVRARHKREPGTCLVLEGNARRVTLRAYDARGARDLAVYAEPSPQRDRWVALLAGGKKPKLEPVKVPAHRNGLMAAAPPTAADVGAQPPTLAELQATLPSISPSEAARPVDDHRGKLFMVGPDLAAKWLERNTRNRPLSKDVVMRYADDMKAGRWLLSPDAVAFDTAGNVINGQHRLWAVFESGCTVPLLVAFDLEPETINVLDDHYKRKLPHIHRILHPGSTVQTNDTATATAMRLAMLTRQGRATEINRLTRQDQLAFLDRHSAAIHFALHEAVPSRRRGLTGAQVLAVVARAYYTEDLERLKAFGEALISGVVERSREDVAVILLRNWLLGQVARQSRAQADLVRRKTERALRAFLDREPIKKLYEAADEDWLFPLPEEQKPRGRRKRAEVTH